VRKSERERERAHTHKEISRDEERTKVHDAKNEIERKNTIGGKKMRN